MSTQVYHDPSYVKEVWGIFGAGVFVLAARHFVRLRTAGLRRYQGDDYISILVLGFHIIDAATVTIIYYKGSNVDYIGRSLDGFSDAQIKDIVYGSKMEKLAWFSYVSLIWGLKACLLFFYNRITFGLTQQLMVRIMAVVSGLTYVAMILTLCLSCRPFRLNWQVVPLPPENCMVRRQDFIVCTTLNTITDAFILSIPVPLLWKLRVPLNKKIPIGVLLCSGIFVIVAAIVRVVMTLGSHPSALTINRWGMRETIAALTAVNAPVLKPLFNKSFWKRGCMGSSSGSSARNQHSDPNQGRNPDSNGTSNTGNSSAISKLSTIFRKPDAVELVDMSNIMKSQCEAPPMPHEVEHVGLRQQHTNESQDLIIQRPEPVRRREQFDLERLQPHPGVRKDRELGIFDHETEEHEPGAHEHTRSRPETLSGEGLHAPYSHHLRRQERDRQTGRVVRVRSHTIS